jgi:leader peptidase (prepilin peptidase)/N-methyltransferase
MIETVIAFLFGLLIGSFLNVCIYRLPRDLSVVRPRSFCPGCDKTIAWYDNIPVVSYILLGGHCRFCKARIPLRYPVVELCTGIAFAVCFFSMHVTMLAVKYAIFSAILIALIATDKEERILPDEFTLGGTVVGIVLAYFVPLDPSILSIFLPSTLGPHWTSVAEAAFAAACASGITWLIGWTYEKLRHREGMGLGDVKMMATAGAFLGLSGGLLTLFLGSTLGAVSGIVFVFVTSQDDKLGYELPFGSFLGIAAFLVAIYSRLLTVWYPQVGH